MDNSTLNTWWWRWMTAWKIFFNSKSGPLMQNVWEPLISVERKSPLSHRVTEEALCLCTSDCHPCDCGTTCTYGILLAIPGFLQIMCFKGTEKKNSHDCHDFSLIFPTFYSLLSILKATARLQETNSLKAISFQKKGSSLSSRANHIVLIHSCAASQGWALTGISHHVLGYTTGSGNPFIQWQWVLQSNYALCE